ncbi:polysaccharide deacetylase family sporulation protein PdaB [Paenibacillus sp. UNCCL117]|uniref:polysaccharide deacetylase family protein n=1 Tax=unclassified Paenibacillus TaxID=185978 RepID=UPI000880A0EC|nr:MULTISPECIES: polysaccharide deacetylase family protein [unclassified Paenibacillus]SDE14957.1 polysaccharide deacetylase family sporulation protein PdaB [Paenibacillus sp. cl123]SFW60753.1 polysaccharide deacetylase family sporulation protein PdaB [Paenibacillus sp. UNCCL117]
MRLRIYVGLLATFVLVAGLCLPAVQAAPRTPANSRSYYEERGEVVWEVPSDEKIIALTFDDGPDEKDTPAILDLLKQYEARATFFVVGKRVEEFPELVKREVDEGHEIANHTYSHTYFRKKMPDTRIEEQLMKAEHVIENATGKKTKLFRPPGGYYSENVVRAAKKSGYLVVMWSWHQDTEDWDTPGVGKIVNKVLNNARNGDIVLFHDHVEGRTQTIEALKQILPELKARGYRFVTVSELLTFRKSTTVEK